MSPLWCILIDLLLLWFFLGDWILAHALPAAWQRRRLLLQTGKTLRQKLRRNRDLLSPEQISQGESLLAKVEQVRREGKKEEQEALLATVQKGIPLPPPPPGFPPGSQFRDHPGLRGRGLRPPMPPAAAL